MARSDPFKPVSSTEPVRPRQANDLFGRRMIYHPGLQSRQSEMMIAVPGSETAAGWTPNPSAHTLSLPEQIAERIGNDIILGRYEPGARIQEQEVAAGFQVSRGPVREALRILERDGLIQINARRGAQVTELTIAELEAIFDPRIALNGLAARRAAERQDPIALARFKAAVDRCQALAQSDDLDAYLKASYTAHRTICEASGNPFLTRLVFLLAHQTLRYARLGLSTPRRRQQSARNWRLMLNAVMSGNGDQAQAAAERLAQESRDTAVRLLTEAQSRITVAAKPAPRSRKPREPGSSRPARAQRAGASERS
jgi:DNA-binding GntR family transcriptional regulator